MWLTYLRVRVELWRFPAPEAIRRLGRAPPPRRGGLPPLRWSHLVTRSLRHGPHQPRCLFEALTLYRLLVREGHEPELVIGLPDVATNQIAHAWVELYGHDIGPSPGDGHMALARYST